MKRTLTLFFPLALMGLIFAQDAKSPEKKQAKPEHVASVQAALTFEAPAKPKKLHQLLVFSKTNGFRHSSIEIGVKAMELLGDKTKAFAVTATESEDVFEADSLKKFDGILLLNTTGNIFRPGKDAKDPEKEGRLRKNFQDFVEKGGALIGFHSATDTNADWPEYLKMMGGTFGGHPWHESVGVKNVDPAHAVNKSFEGKDFRITDEIYQWKPGSFSSSTHRVLLAMDNKTTNMDKKNKEGKDTTNGPNKVYPITVVRKYGQGRVFYCSLGHREEIYWNPAVLQHFLAGIQYALGDLEADATPANVGEEW